MKTYIAFSGSLRKDSFNTNLAKAAIALAPEDMKIELMDISTLPLYNQDKEATEYPEAAATMKSKILAADGVIFVTPEYNRSVPGVLKNAIDWISRPYGTNPFAGKPALVMSASFGSLSGGLANYHLKQILLFLDAHIVGQPEFFLGMAHEKFDAAGTLTDETTKQHLLQALEALKNR